MKSSTRWALVLVAGILLLFLPTAVSVLRERGAAPPPANQQAQYTPPAVATPALAATPIPTATPRRSQEAAALPTAQLPRGPVVVDLAHYSLIERARFQPLASALAPYGLDLRFWLPTVDTANIEQITDFPDQSAALEKQLAGASALVVISPFFLYTPAEVLVVERFVADGGRLLLISDPDVESDSASDTNHLAAAFNVIFNQDYLYDTVANDANFTYFFQGEFTGAARSLAGSRIAFYGGRSIGGAVEPQVRSAATTLSSLRDGLTGFNTVALGGAAANSSAGRVLAMSDFDVLTDPYVARHDNRRMLAFVAAFLAAAERDNGLADFPSFLAKEVRLAIDNTQPVGALALGKAAELQRMLEASGRTLRLGSTGILTAAQESAEEGDLIYVAGYRALQDQPALLSSLDLRLVEEVVTPTVSAPAVIPTLTGTPSAPPAAVPGEGQQPGDKGAPPAPVAPPEVPPLGTPLPPTAPPTPAVAPSPALTPDATTTGDANRLPAPPAQEATPTAVITGTVAPPAPTTAPTTAPAEAPAEAPLALAVTAAITETPAADTATPTATSTATPSPTPQVRLLLERGDGLRLLADETLLYVRQTGAGPGKGAAPRQMLAVLGNSEQAISAALTRLLNRDFAGCLVQSELVICPYSPGVGGPAAPSASMAATPTAAATPGAGDDPAPAPPTPAVPSPNDARVLIVDDNAGAGAGEPSEAAIYLTSLTTAGYTPDLWVIGEQGVPAGSDLIPYAWVVWSDAGYAVSGIDGENLRVIGEYINQGGRLTISSRMPFFGVGPKSPSAVRDIQVTDAVPELAAGLPTTPIALTSETPLLSPLEENPDPETDARSALVRGPVSGDQGAPVLILMSDAAFEDPKGARLLLFGLSMGWLPPEISDQLIRNMAEVMLAE